MIRQLAPVGLIAALAAVGLLALLQESEPHQPNILVIISDDQGVVDSPEYHYDPSPPHTPNLSALANEGVIFENAWATPMCFTTRAAYLTGLHGTRNGVLTGGVPIRLRIDARIPERPRAAKLRRIANGTSGRRRRRRCPFGRQRRTVLRGRDPQGNFGAEGSYDGW